MPSERPVLIVGAGGHGRVILDILLCQRRTVLGFVDSYKPIGERVAGDYAIVARDGELGSMADSAEFLIGVGDCWTRSKIALALRERYPALRFTTAVHPSAVVATDVTLGAGTVVMAGAVINTGSRIGEHAIFNTNSSVDHDCEIQDFAGVLPGATLGGNVTVGSFSVVALGARIIHGIRVGSHSVIGAGATAVSDVPDSSIFVGTPARLLRERKPGEPFL